LSLPRGIYDKSHQPIYDTLRYDGGAKAAFFCTPLGFGSGLFGGAKTILETNMYLPGQLPAGCNFVTHALEVDVFAYKDCDPLKARGDRQRLISAGYVEFSIGAKNYTQIPLTLAARRMRRRYGALLSDGQDDAMKHALAMMDRMAMSLPPPQFDRLSEFVSELFLGPPGFSFEDDAGHPHHLTLTENQNFIVQVLYPGQPAIQSPLAVRVLLHGVTMRPFV
jgi:hypothetical protein